MFFLFASSININTYLVDVGAVSSDDNNRNTQLGLNVQEACHHWYRYPRLTFLFGSLFSKVSSSRTWIKTVVVFFDHLNCLALLPELTARNQQVIMKGSSGKSILRLTMNRPIQPAASYGLPLLCTGLFLALHPLAWIILQSYRDKPESLDDYNVIIQVVLDTLAHWILDILPQVASSMLTLYIAIVMMFVGTVYP